MRADELPFTREGVFVKKNYIIKRFILLLREYWAFEKNLNFQKINNYKKHIYLKLTEK